MVPSMNNEVRHIVVGALLPLAGSGEYQDRADAGRALAIFAELPEARQPLQHRRVGISPVGVQAGRAHFGGEPVGGVDPRIKGRYQSDAVDTVASHGASLRMSRNRWGRSTPAADGLCWSISRPARLSNRCPAAPGGCTFGAGSVYSVM
jgi:hypothetical protein